MFSPIPNGIRITFVINVLGKPCTVNIHVTSAVPVTEAILNTALSTAAGIWQDTWRGLVTTANTLSAIEVTDVSVPNGMQVRQTTFANPSGSDPSESMSNQVAVVLSFRTPFIGRSFRGRVYIPGISTASVINNNLSGPALSGFNSLASAFRTAFAANNLTLVVASKVANGVQRPTAVATPVTSAVVNSRVDTQRRRLPKI